MPDTLNNSQWPSEGHISGLEVCMWDLTLQKPGRKSWQRLWNRKKMNRKHVRAVSNLNDVDRKIIFFITGWLGLLHLTLGCPSDFCPLWSCKDNPGKLDILYLKLAQAIMSQIRPLVRGLSTQTQDSDVCVLTGRVLENSCCPVMTEAAGGKSHIAWVKQEDPGHQKVDDVCL